MSIAAGTRLGPYEIVAPLGAGGMGEVFRARDTRLDREVAVKVLPQHLSASPEVRARFDREAKAISSLNHPHICTLHDVGREGDTDYLVMELIEGETLAERLAKGALSPAEVLEFGAQITDALDRAHRAGVIHRDLKPGNVMLTKSGAKLMDFGLARATAPSSDSGIAATMTHAPTMTTPLTAEGSIVGTFQYMAPEQLEGTEADARSDLWALGCVLYEMATGRRPFEGKSQASLIGSIMGAQPAPISQLAPMSPPGLEKLVQACLSKDPADRLQSAHDIRMQLTWLAEGGSQAGVPAPVAAKRRSRERLAWGVATVAVIAATILAWSALGSREPAAEAIQSLIDAPEDHKVGWRTAEMALSPDGRTLVFVAHGDDASPLWIRPLGSDTATILPGTEGALRPFWSPDSSTIAYFSDRAGKLMRVPAAGGSPTSICDAINGRGGSWSLDDTIIFSPSSSGPLVRVSAAGGEPVPVTTLDESRNESGHRFPVFLPDGEHFLFATLPAKPDGWDTYLGSLSSGTVNYLLTARSVATYVEPGYVLFSREGRVLAQRFDAERLELEGAPVSIAEAPMPSDLDAEPVASASRNGRLAILRSRPENTRLEIRGQNRETIARIDMPPAPWDVSSAAPDGRRAAVLKGDELWVVDLARSVPMRVATDLASIPTTVWSPDGRRIAFAARHEEREEIFIGEVDDQAELVPTTDEAFKGVADWSDDGRHIVFWAQNPETGLDLWILPVDGDRKPVPYLRSPANETTARISPDGRWLAYESDETGQNEIYVQSFPEPGNKVRISIDGGAFPGWPEGGKKLRYVNPNRRQIVEVEVEAGDVFEPGPPTKVRDFTSNAEKITGRAWLPDRRWLVSVAEEERPRDIRLILDWTALLEP